MIIDTALFLNFTSFDIFDFETEMIIDTLFALCQLPRAKVRLYAIASVWKYFNPSVFL